MHLWVEPATRLPFKFPFCVPRVVHVFLPPAELSLVDSIHRVFECIFHTAVRSSPRSRSIVRFASKKTLFIRGTQKALSVGEVWSMHLQSIQQRIFLSVDGSCRGGRGLVGLVGVFVREKIRVVDNLRSRSRISSQLGSAEFDVFHSSQT